MRMIEPTRSTTGRNGEMSAEIKARPLRILAGLSCLLMLSACGSVRDATTTGSIDDYRQRHPIVVAEAEHSIEIPVATGEYSLSFGTREVVRGFGQRRASREKGTVQVLYPQGSPNAVAAKGVSKQIRTELQRGGVDPGLIVEGTYPAAGMGAAPVRLSYVATTAMVDSECGQWPKSIAPDMANGQYHNFGCASQNNLAAQIANPTDLLGPRAMSPADADQRNQGLKRYREFYTTLED